MNPTLIQSFKKVRLYWVDLYESDSTRSKCHDSTMENKKRLKQKSNTLASLNQEHMWLLCCDKARNCRIQSRNCFPEDKKNPKSRYTFWMASSADLFPRNMFQSACIKLNICAGFEFMVGFYCSKDGTANVCMSFWTYGRFEIDVHWRF